MATHFGMNSSTTATNKVYIALAAVILAIILAIAYTTLTRTSTTVPTTPNIYID